MEEIEVKKEEEGKRLDSYIAGKKDEITRTTAQRLIEECLIINPYIVDVQVVDTYFKENTLTCDIKITTIYGDLEVSI